jgi:hypothetical protein
MEAEARAKMINSLIIELDSSIDHFKAAPFSVQVIW